LARLQELEGAWQSRLQEWDLNSSEPIATPIVPKSRDEVVALMATHPKADFLLPESFGASIPAHSKRSRRRISARSGAAVYPCLSVFIRVELP
jgi:hypothetical protein